MKRFTLNAIVKTMQSPIIEKAKVTSVTTLYWNDMEGYNYQINVKLVTVEGYKDKLVAIVTNSTYLDEWDADRQTLASYIESLLNSQEKLLKTA